MVPGLEDQYLHLLDHFNKCGSRSMSTKKTGSLKLIENVHKLMFSLYAFVTYISLIRLLKLFFTLKLYGTRIFLIWTRGFWPQKVNRVSPLSSYNIQDFIRMLITDENILFKSKHDKYNTILNISTVLQNDLIHSSSGRKEDRFGIFIYLICQVQLIFFNTFWLYLYTSNHIEYMPKRKQNRVLNK